MPPTHGLVDRKAPVERIQLDDTSWIDVVRAFAHDTERTFEWLVDTVEWHQNREIRGGKKVDDPRLYGALDREVADADPTFKYARLILDARYNVKLTGPSLVYYRDGRDSMGFHRDDEMRWVDKTIITGLAFGATRPFQLVARAGGPITEIVMESGDLYVMGGRCQADWYHGVPKLPECGPKISAVWRWTAKIGRPIEPYRG